MITFKELRQISEPHYHSLSLDKYFPKIFRNVLRKLIILAAAISFILSFDSLPLYFSKADGFFFLFLFFYIGLIMLEFFYRSMANEGLFVRINENLIKNNNQIDFALSRVLFITDEIDVTRAFFESKIGSEILIRSGILPEISKNFIYSERPLLMASSLNFDGDRVDLVTYAETIFEADKSLQNFLSKNSINKKEFSGSTKWIMEVDENKRRKERFWSRENLGAVPSIGTSWSYGIVSDLGKFGLSFGSTVNINSLDIENGFRNKEVSALEGILERREEANAIIIDDDENVARDIVGRFLKKIKLGISPPSLENKNINEFDWHSLFASFKLKNELEGELLKILNQSMSAGNIILYINDFSGMLTSAKNSGINLSSLFAPYLSSRNLQIIASVSNSDFHYFIENNSSLIEKFERIIPDVAGVDASVGPLLEKVPLLEKQYGFFFSYPSILALAGVADRYVTYGEMPDKAISMMIEIAPWAKERKISILKEEDVNIFASEKTGVAAGRIKENEAEKITHLEEILHRRIVGQNEAVSGIANAVRGARSGVNNPKRPISSFLFIGPTGVGKTEVSKALAESFFGDEKKMIRFDMSEYNGADAMLRLIGDYTSNRSGLLASKIRDNPYGVLLLDEFEKAAPDVLDLFLQILDEGVFTDALGKPVDCRNLIIIATSNAGSTAIWEMIQAGKNLSEAKDQIVNSIIESKIFRPELLNRFDGVILFHPLLKDDLKKVARLGLEKLVKRLKERDIDFVINDEIVNFLVEERSDPQFGGRSINRAIQGEIEDLIAKKIVSGEAKPGAKIEINRSELK